ncbi:HDOD domain-containing protein [Fontivita pretiosa]|uniref:HDOD domain-containing protein n=1 Tax=Fontivita pretiosa TaxID=2989684 RepID=UPI003D183FC4
MLQVSEYKSRLARARQDQVMALIQALPVMPTAVNVPVRIMQLYRDPNSPPIERFAEVLVADAALSAKVLELANSAFFCPSKPITRVSDALRRIGLSNMLPLLFGLSLAGLFNKANLPSEDRTRLWHKSLFKAVVARQWARWRKSEHEEEAFLCGVLQDAALPAMYAGDRAAAMELAGVLDLEGDSRYQREVALYGVDHAEFGRRLCARLALPELYVRATATHHAPDGPDLPEEFAELRAGLMLAAQVPHGASRLDDAGLRKLGTCFAQVCPDTSAADFAEFMQGVCDSARSLTAMLSPADPTRRAGMKSFLQDVSDQIARTLFAAIGASSRAIQDLEHCRVELEARVRELSEQIVQADFDSLTDVLNRRGFFSRAEQLLSLGRQAQLGCAVGYVDLDQFKQVNDRHGQEAGDAALAGFAAAIRNLLRDRGIVGRFGGDEFAFAMLVPPQLGRDGVVQQIESALASVSVSLPGGAVVELRSSIGIAWLGVPQEGHTIQAALAHADRAMCSRCRSTLAATS